MYRMGEGARPRGPVGGRRFSRCPCLFLPTLTENAAAFGALGDNKCRQKDGENISFGKNERMKREGEWELEIDEL